MIEVFTTDIPNKDQAKKIVENLNIILPTLKLSYDIENNKINYPCNHSIIRVEGDNFNTNNVITLIAEFGYQCDILKDKVCIKK